MLTVPVKIKKEAIVKVCGKPPRLLTGPYEIDGATHPTASLVFLGFRGVKVANGVWGGDYLFEFAGPQVPETKITAEVLSNALSSAATRKKK